MPEHSVATAERPPPSRARARPSFAADFAGTTAIQGVTALLNVGSLAIISRRLGEIDLGYYTLERRSSALIVPLVLLGVSVATPRYIALALGRGSGDERSYAVTGGLIVAFMAAATGALMAVWPRPVAGLVFGDPDAVGLARALAGLVVASALYQIVYAAFRGYLRMRRANGLELVTVGLAPVALAMAGPTDFLAFMWALNGVIFAATVAAVVPWRRATRPLGSAVGASRRRGRELLRYGIPRTPGDFAVIAPFALAPLAVVHSAGPLEAGYTSVTLSTLNLVSIVAGPLGVLVLPHVALEVGASATRTETWGRLAQATLDVSIGVAALLVLASPLVAAIWFADVPRTVVEAQRVVALGVPGYVFYMVFRSYLDAVDARPLSTLATMSGLLCFGAALPLLLLSSASATIAASAAVAVSVTAMGAVTWWLTRGRLSGYDHAGTALPPLLAALVIAAAGIALDDAGAGPIALAVLLAAAAYAGLLLALRRPWLVALLAPIGLRWRGGG